MHRAVVSHTLVTATDFIVTASVDGHIKFWKKQPQGIEFVKDFRAHTAPIVGLSTTSDGALLASTSEDKTIKVFDVVNFDMINIITIDYVPGTCCWVSKPGAAKPLIACTTATGAMNYYVATDATQGVTEPFAVHQVHRAPVRLLRYNAKTNIAVSIDDKCMIELWDPETGKTSDKVRFKFKTQTDLYALAKAKVKPQSVEISNDGSLFSVMASDRQVRIFRTLTGSLYRKFDESIQMFTAQQKDEKAPFKLDSVDFGRRMATEHTLNKTNHSPCNITFDQSGNFVMYSTMIGIKMVNIKTNELIRVIGSSETGARFLSTSLYQGTITGSAAEGNLAKHPKPDPAIVAVAFSKPRFYLFGRMEPEDMKDDTTSEFVQERDVYNERPPKELASLGMGKRGSDRIASSAIIYTNMGDIHIELYGQQCPLAVENFTVHSRNGYYNGLIFHRVIKDFMIQTGDPVGDGTGGVSIWGKNFKDEIHTELNHKKSYMVSMANKGKNENGSQFFITTVPLPHLDGKHTVFGRVVKGTEVVSAIEKVRVNKHDKPYDDIKIVSIKAETPKAKK